MKKCKVDPKHMVDSYGCFDCFWNEVTRQSLIEMYKDENN